jgi:hypothetical protein
VLRACKQGTSGLLLAHLRLRERPRVRSHTECCPGRTRAATPSTPTATERASPTRRARPRSAARKLQRATARAARAGCARRPHLPRVRTHTEWCPCRTRAATPPTSRAYPYRMLPVQDARGDPIYLDRNGHPLVDSQGRSLFNATGEITMDRAGNPRALTKRGTPVVDKHGNPVFLNPYGEYAIDTNGTSVIGRDGTRVQVRVRSVVWRFACRLLASVIERGGARVRSALAALWALRTSSDKLAPVPCSVPDESSGGKARHSRRAGQVRQPRGAQRARRSHACPDMQPIALSHAGRARQPRAARRARRAHDRLPDHNTLTST